MKYAYHDGFGKYTTVYISPVNISLFSKSKCIFTKDVLNAKYSIDYRHLTMDLKKTGNQFEKKPICCILSHKSSKQLLIEYLLLPHTRVALYKNK